MEARLKTLLLAIGIGVAVLTQIACEADPARAMKIPRVSNADGVATNGAPSPAVGAEIASARLPWNAALCTSFGSSGGPSTLLGTGACEFREQAAAHCIITDDDVLMEITRPVPNDAQFMIFVGIEDFQAREHPAEIVVGLRTPEGLYRWAAKGAKLELGPDEDFVVADKVVLPAVPPLRAPALIVSGKFACGKIDREP